jgi:CHAT domain-containing protein
VQSLMIDADTARQLSRETPAARRLGGEEGLSAQDKIQILDAQAMQLRGSILRLQDKPAEATAALRQAESQLMVVRNGRVAATQWMRGQILADLADIAEAAGNRGEAERLLREATEVVELHYPDSLALVSARGRLASFYARTGQTDEALATFRAIVAANTDTGSASPALRRILGTYFDLLLKERDQAAAANEMFLASQLLVRPGLAQTQAVLARELSGGSDEAARLFRQSVNLNREAERLRVEIGRLRAADASDSRIQALSEQLEQVARDQTSNQSALSAFPRYRAVSNAAIPLADLQAQLRPGEGYYKMVALPDSAFGVFATREGARAMRIGLSTAELEAQVDNIRATISNPQTGETLPFDIEGSHRLYTALFAPVGADLAGVTHLVFEPDGAMLRLPPNLLVMDQASIATYQARAADPQDDGFDFRGVAWLGRDRDISTAVSPRAFKELRESAPSQASAQYIGFGQHKPTNAFFMPAGATRSAVSDACQWSYAAWARPISASELQTARQLIGGDVVTGAAFTDDGIKARADLDHYRIVHFATHGLLAPPRPECPVRPALMTSFGEQGSDGMLTFAEIFDLDLDADLIILSACDTASGASSAANREAGITTGGTSAMDGLVRAFVGAGGRLIVASHWPVPDDFNATERLITGLFTAPPGTPAAGAMRRAQLALMDDALTSHPFYWSGFALVGDGTIPVVRAAPVQTAAAQQ